MALLRIGRVVALMKISFPCKLYIILGEEFNIDNYLILEQ
jgi:hypothetical protein